MNRGGRRFFFNSGMYKHGLKCLVVRYGTKNKAAGGLVPMALCELTITCGIRAG